MFEFRRVGSVLIQSLIRTNYFSVILSIRMQVFTCNNLCNSYLLYKKYRAYTFAVLFVNSLTPTIVFFRNNIIYITLFYVYLCLSGQQPILTLQIIVMSFSPNIQFCAEISRAKMSSHDLIMW